ncbi:hypothetical protein V2J09_023871 [Rumex salicifolius]
MQTDDLKIRTSCHRDKVQQFIAITGMRTIVNAERRNKATTELKPVSTVMCSFLNIMKKRGYIKEYEVHDVHRVRKITVQLLGRVNDCKALTYRQDLKAKDIEEYKTRMLPTRQWGYVVVTTPNGVLDHEEAIKQNVGGQLRLQAKMADSHSINPNITKERPNVLSSPELHVQLHLHREIRTWAVAVADLIRLNLIAIALVAALFHLATFCFNSKSN